MEQDQSLRVWLVKNTLHWTAGHCVYCHGNSHDPSREIALGAGYVREWLDHGRSMYTWMAT